MSILMSPVTPAINSLKSSPKSPKSTTTTSSSNLGRSSPVEDFEVQLRKLRDNETEILIKHLTIEAGNLATKGLASDVTLAIRKIFHDALVPKIRVLYLIDSIKKRFGENVFKELISVHLSDLFCKTFMTDIKNRLRLFKLRESWKRIFDTEFLDDIDIRIHYIDKKWPLWSDQAREKYAKRFGHQASSEKVSLEVNQSVPANQTKVHPVEKRSLLGDHPHHLSTSHKNQHYKDQSASKPPQTKHPKLDSNSSNNSRSKSLDPLSPFKNQNAPSNSQISRKKSQDILSSLLNDTNRSPLQQKLLESFESQCPHLISVIKQAKLINFEYTIVFGNEEFSYRLSDKPFTIKLSGVSYTIYINSNDLVLYINENPVYCIFSPVTFFNGLETFFRSHPISFFLNSTQFDLHHNAPPQEVQIGDRRSYAQIKDFYLYIDNNLVSKCYERRHKVELHKKSYYLTFCAPPERIPVDGAQTEFVFDGYFPLKKGEDGKRYCAHFDGADAIVSIDGVDHKIFLKKRNFIQISGRKCDISLGGPFFELIVNGVCHSLLFDGQSINIKIRRTMHTFALKPPSPKLSFIQVPKALNFRHVPIQTENKFVCNLQLPILSTINQNSGFIDNHQMLPIEPTQTILPIDNSQKTHLMTSNAQFNSDQQGLVKSNSNSAITNTNNSHSNQNPLMMSNLFSKLLNHGLIGEPGAQRSISSERSAANITKQETAQNSLPDLTSFDPKLMSQFYPKLLDAIYQPEKCSHCGIRFAKSEKKLFHNHLDMHFRLKQANLKTTINSVKHFQIYYTTSAWVHYNASTNLNSALDDTNITLDADEDLNLDSSQHNLSNSNTASSNKDSKSKNIVYLFDDLDADFCSECKDSFEHFWDQSREVWAVKNAVLHDGQVYHTNCKSNINL